MNKILSIAASCMMLFLPLSAFAQAEMTDVTPLTMGSHSITFQAGDNDEVSCMYSYKAVEAGYLTVDGTSSIIYFQTLDTKGNELSCLKRNPGCVVPLREGDEMLLRVSPNLTFETDTIAYFKASFTANDNACRGKEPAAPIVITNNSTNITTDTVDGFAEFPSYLVYDATDDGALNLSFSGYVLSGSFGDSFDNLNGSFTASYDGGLYKGIVPVEKGKQVCIRITAYEAMSVAASMSYPERGFSPNYPLLLQEGDNEVSAEFGEYWYKYEGAAEDGYVSISSEYEIPRGYVQVVTADLTQSVAKSQTGEYDVRFKVQAHTPYLIYVYKPEESEEWPDPDLFSLSFEPLQTGESASNPIGLTANVAEPLKTVTGTYYYALTIPADAESKMIELQLSGKGAEGCFVTLYDQIEGRYYASTGYGSVSKVGIAGHAYIIELDKQVGGEGVLMPLVRDIRPGEHISNPITALLGANGVNKATEVYYQYVAAQTGYLTVHFDIPGVMTEFPVSKDMSQGMYSPNTTGGQTRLDVKAGTTYYIRLSGLSEDCVMTLSERPYQQGDTREMAYEMGETGIAIGTGMMNVWFRYVAPKSGKLTVGTSFIGDENTYIYCCTDREPNPQLINNSNEDGDIIYYHVRPVEKGEVLYVHYVAASDRAGERIHCSISDYAIGETKENPYLLSLGESLTVPTASRSQYRWICIPVNGSTKVTIASDRFISGGIYTSLDTTHGYDLFFTPDENNEVHTAIYESPSPVENLYVCIEHSNGAIVLSAVSEGNPSALSILKEITDETVVYGLDGTRRRSLQEGLNIILGKDGKARKMIRK